jgi:hypothetical protein
MRAVNLIPADQRSGASVGVGRSEGGAYAVLGLLAGVALLALLYGLASHQVAKRRSESAALAAKVAQAEVQASRLAPYTSFLALREQRVEAVNTLISSRFDWAHAFHEFGRVLPTDVSISSLTGAIGAAAATTAAATPTPPAAATATPAAAGTAAAASTVTSATPPGSVPVFTLAGCAVSQPAVARMLERLRLIDGVSEVTLQSSTAGSGGGGCPAGGPAFSVQITFDALPTPSVSATAAKTVATSSAASASSATATTTAPSVGGTNG